MMGLYYLGAGDGAKALTEFASLAKDHPNDLGVSQVIRSITDHEPPIR